MKCVSIAAIQTTTANVVAYMTNKVIVMTQITLSAEELAVLLTEAKNEGAQGAPDYSTADAVRLIALIEQRRNQEANR